MNQPPQSRRSMRRALQGTLCVLVLTAASPSAAKDPKSCGDLEEHAARIQAHEVTCEKAKEVAQAYDAMLMEKMSFPSTKTPMEVRGFSCRTRSDGYESYKVRCTQAQQVITFDWGV